MTIQVTLNVLDEQYRRAEQLAALTGRTVEAILTDRLNDFIPDYPLEHIEEIVKLLSDAQVLHLANSMMNTIQNQRMSELLEEQQAGQIDSIGRDELESLLKIYDRGTTIKSYALNEAIQRGLRQPVQR